MKHQKSNIELIPYTEVDGIRTYKDSDILDLYDRIIEDGYEYMFSDGTIGSRDKFLHTMKYKDNQLYVLYIDRVIAGVMWLNDFNGKVAKMHWCVYNHVSTRQKLYLMRDAVDQVLNIKEKSGGYLFDLIIGTTPVSNELAARFVLAAGAKLAGEVPNLLWNETEGRSESGYITYRYRGMDDEDIQ
jgi:hypothetical protein